MAWSVTIIFWWLIPGMNSTENKSKARRRGFSGIAYLTFLVADDSKWSRDMTTTEKRDNPFSFLAIPHPSLIKQIIRAESWLLNCSYQNKRIVPASDDWVKLSHIAKKKNFVEDLISTENPKWKCAIGWRYRNLTELKNYEYVYRCWLAFPGRSGSPWTSISQTGIARLVTKMPSGRMYPPSSVS